MNLPRIQMQMESNSMKLCPISTNEQVSTWTVKVSGGRLSMCSEPVRSLDHRMSSRSFSTVSSSSVPDRPKNRFQSVLNAENLLTLYLVFGYRMLHQVVHFVLLTSLRVVF